MAIIPMKSTFTIIPEGTHIFRIYNVEYDKDFGKLTVHLVNAQGITHKEMFRLMNNDGSMNEGACGAFSYLAKTALKKYDIEEIDHTDIIGCYIKAEVKHTVVPSTKDPSKNVTFVNLGDKWEAEYFDTEPCKKALELGTAPATTPAAAPAPTAQPTGLDLNSLLK
jgi:hypothetical protein